MPLPEPSNDENKQNFISRCMSDDNIKKEFSSHKQKLAVCFSQWKRKNENILSARINKYL